MEITREEFAYLSICVEGFLFGVYTGMFAMHLQYYVSRKDASKGNNIIFYALCLLYLLSLVVIVCDFIAATFVQNIYPNRGDIIVLPLQITAFACCDFTSQSILIYRCWIVWGYNIRVVIVPSILAFAFLAIWIAAGTAYIIGGLFFSAWNGILSVTGIALSMTVNALVMSLIVFRIIKVFRDVNPTSYERFLGTTHGSRLRSMIFVLIESGMILFFIQLVRLVLVTLEDWAGSLAVFKAYPLIFAIHEMFNGITPTIILVRVSMGLSFHDESSMAEATGSLCFAPANDPNPISETESTSNVDQEKKDYDDLQFMDIELSVNPDIQIVDRSEERQQHDTV